MKKIFLSTVLAALVAMPVAAQDKQVVRQLKACGSEATNAFGKHRENPVINEGGGFVGFETETTDATGTKQRYSLVNCVNRDMVQIKVEYLLADSSKGLPKHGDLFKFVDGLRSKKRVANPDLFSKAAEQSGYSPVRAKAPKQGTDLGARVDCGCRLFYPETM